nr:hypothetical protein COLO4_29510 [Ipomoea batatas]
MAPGPLRRRLVAPAERRLGRDSPVFSAGESWGPPPELRNQHALYPVNYAVRSDHIVDSEHLRRAHLPLGHDEILVAGVSAQSEVILYRFLRPVLGLDSSGNDVKQNQILERPEIPRLKQESFKLRVQISLQGLIFRRKNRDIVAGNSFLESLQQKRLLHELRQLGIMRIQKRH